MFEEIAQCSRYSTRTNIVIQNFIVFNNQFIGKVFTQIFISQYASSAKKYA